MRIKARILQLVHMLRTKEKVPIIELTGIDKLLSGKVALISGGSGGLGKEMAHALLNSGCKVIIAGTSREKLINIVSRYNTPNLKYLVIDMKEIESFEEKIDVASALFGKNNIDILINCAGVNDGTPFLDVSEKTFDNIFDINVKGMYFLSQVVAKHMINNNIKGHILNVSSASALRPASAPYAISKWAVSGMTKGLADVLLKYGITVNAIGPGPTATEMLGKREGTEINHDANPSGRYVTPQEVANLALFMVSGMGDLIIGDTFYITGGAGTISMHR